MDPFTTVVAFHYGGNRLSWFRYRYGAKFVDAANR